MAINFPSDPVLNDTFTIGNSQYVFDGVSWIGATTIGGAQGIQGVQGLQGAGTQGSTGAQGTQGVQGPTGTNLASDTVAGLGPAGTVGRMVYVTDGAAALAWGDTVSGGSTEQYLVWDNGTNWTVVGK